MEDESLVKYLKSIKNKVNQSIEIVTSHHNCYRIDTFKVNGYYCLEYFRQNNITGKFEYQNGCNLFSSKESMLKAVASNIYYLYKKL